MIFVDEEEQPQGRQEEEGDGLQRLRTEGEVPEVPEDEEEDPYWEGQWGAVDLENRWQGPAREEPQREHGEGDRHGQGRGYQAGYGEGHWVAGFHFGGENEPVPLVQQLSSSEGVPSRSDERSAPMFGSSTSGQRTSGQRSSESERQRQQSTMDTLTSTWAQGSRTKSSEDEDSTLEKPIVKVTTVVEVNFEKKTNDSSKAVETPGEEEERLQGLLGDLKKVAAVNTVVEKTEGKRSLKQRVQTAAALVPADSSSSAPTQPVVSSTANAPASSSSAVAAGSSSSAGPTPETTLETPGEIRNPWNLFQHRNRGKGWSMDKMRAEYYKWKRTQQEP